MLALTMMMMFKAIMATASLCDDAVAMLMTMALATMRSVDADVGGVCVGHGDADVGGTGDVDHGAKDFGDDHVDDNAGDAGVHDYAVATTTIIAAKTINIIINAIINMTTTHITNIKHITHTSSASST